MTSYTVLYDIRASSFLSLSDILLFVFLIVLGALVYVIGGEPRLRKGGGLLSIGAALGLVLVVGVHYSQYRSFSNRLQTGNYTRVEGTVTDFFPGLPKGHREERFKVAGHSYMYSAEVTPGFRQVQGENGPLKNGVQVRIADIDGYIIRLEVANSK